MTSDPQFGLILLELNSHYLFKSLIQLSVLYFLLFSDGLEQDPGAGLGGMMMMPGMGGPGIMGGGGGG